MASPRSETGSRTERNETPRAHKSLPIGQVIQGDCLEVMTDLPDGCCDLIYADPPFFTRKLQIQRNGQHSFPDTWPGGIKAYLGFLEPRLAGMRRLLKQTGSLYVHLDYHAVHYAKVMLDELFGSDHFVNEIIWSYRTGGLSRRWFARKHDTILVYARQKNGHKFNVLREGAFRTDGMNYDEAGRPYKQTRKGRLYFNPQGPAITDVWDIPFLSTVSLERTGYPTQKPEALLGRIIRASTDPGDVVGDFFCGSGTSLAVAKKLGRDWIGCDVAPDAVRIATDRLGERMRH